MFSPRIIITILIYDNLVQIKTTFILIVYKNFSSIYFDFLPIVYSIAVIQIILLYKPINNITIIALCYCLLKYKKKITKTFLNIFFYEVTFTRVLLFRVDSKHYLAFFFQTEGLPLVFLVRWIC